MDLKTMYPAGNSRYVQLAQDIAPDQEIIPVSDVSHFPAPPNYAAVETWDDQEIFLYTGIDGENNLLTGCSRGMSGTEAKGWLAGGDVLHVITADNLNSIMENIKRAAADLAALDAAALDARFAAKADTATSTPFTLPAAAWAEDGEHHTQTVTLERVNENAVVGVATTATAEEVEAIGAAGIRITGQTATTISFAADGEAPEMDLPLTLINLG